jgi:hypothetical protein
VDSESPRGGSCEASGSVVQEADTAQDWNTAQEAAETPTTYRLWRSGTSWFRNGMCSEVGCGVRIRKSGR